MEVNFVEVAGLASFEVAVVVESMVKGWACRVQGLQSVRRRRVTF